MRLTHGVPAHWSAVFVHVVVVSLVVAGGDVVHPLLVVEVPSDCLLYPLLELQAGLPSEFRLKLARVDRVAHVVAESVGDIGYEMVGMPLRVPEHPVNSLDYDLYEVDVLPLVESPDVVCVGNFAFMEDEVDCPRVVLHEQPVAHVLPLAVHGQRLSVAYIVYEQRD